MTNHNEVTDERRTLINALVASKGWNHGYAAAFVDDYANHRTCNSSATSDAAMLDFVITNLAWIQTVNQGDSESGFQCWTQDEDENYIVLSGRDEFFDTEREAIDAAIAAGGSQNG